MPNIEVITLQNVTFNTDEHFVAVATASEHEWVLLLNTGNLFRFRVGDATGTPLFSLAHYVEDHCPDKGFDLNAQISIYLLDEIVVLVNDFKLHGYVYRPGKKGPKLHLWREDYHADISKYPIALYRDFQNIPHLIYGTAWNRLDILNLETLQKLTALKSLIEEGAEAFALEVAAKYGNANNLPWPSPFDYFYGPLVLSPDNSHFFSRGWRWGSSDSCCVFSIGDFVSNTRIKPEPLGSWEHSNRGMCWMDNSTIAILYSPWEEGDDESTAESNVEIHQYQLEGHSWKQFKVVPLLGNIKIAEELVYEKDLELFLLFTLHESGLTVFSSEGQLCLNEQSLKIDAYNSEKMLFTSLQEKTVINFALVVTQ